MNAHKRKRGFTLIELLVVIVIIGLLAAIIMANLNRARAGSRDAQRLASIEQIALALEVYRQANGRYPEGGCGRGTSWTGHGSAYGNCDEYIEGLEGLNSLPVDPINDVHGYLYRTDSGGANFKILSYNSVETETADSNEYPRCAASCAQSYCTSSSGTEQTYALYSPAAACW